MTATVRLSEAQWQQRVTDYLTLRSWKWIHLRPARTTQGWRTAVSGPLGAGWPDIFAVRGTRIVVIELKSSTGKPTAAQLSVLDLLAQVPCIETHLARPSDWDTIMEVLK